MSEQRRKTDAEVEAETQNRLLFPFFLLISPFYYFYLIALAIYGGIMANFRR